MGNKSKFLGTLWQRIVLGFVGLIFVGATAYIKGCFNKTEVAKNIVKSDTVSQNNTNLNTASGTQYNAARDVIINNTPPKQSTVTSSSANKKEKSRVPVLSETQKTNATLPTVVNNGIINNGGTQNTYNQTIKSREQRHVKVPDLRWFELNLPKTYTIEVVCSMGDAETEIYAKEIVRNLKDLNYNASFGGWAMFSGQEFGKIDVNKNDSAKTAKISVYSNKIE